MKFIIVICYAIIPLFSLGQIVKKGEFVDKSTPYVYDYKKCLFSIKVGAWATNNGYDVLPVTTMIKNTSNDTLKYQTMSYRMLAYDIKSATLEYEFNGEDILANYCKLIIIPPHQTGSFDFNLKKKFGVDKVSGDVYLRFRLVLPKTNSNFCYIVDDNGNILSTTKESKESTHWLTSNTIRL